MSLRRCPPSSLVRTRSKSTTRITRAGKGKPVEESTKIEVSDEKEIENLSDIDNSHRT